MRSGTPCSLDKGATLTTRGSPAFDAALGDVSAECAALPEVLAEQSLPGERLALVALQGRQFMLMSEPDASL